MSAQSIIQVAGVRNLQEALMVCEEGATQVGFPLRLDLHAEDTTEEEAKRIVRALPAEVGKTLITYLTDPEEILQLAGFLGVDAVQLHGQVTVEAIERIRAVAPEVTIIRSLIVKGNRGSELVVLAHSAAQFVDFFLTDTYDPATGASGATGKTHDWTVSRRLVQAAGKPVILAGGLTPANVREAILRVTPAGVDTHTGVEGTEGWKDRRLVRAFVSEARRGFGKIAETRE